MWHFLPKLFKAPLWHSAFRERAAHLAVYLCVACPSIYRTLAWVPSPTRTAGTQSNWPGESLQCASKQLSNMRSLAQISSRTGVSWFCCMHRKTHKLQHMQWHTCANTYTYLGTISTNAHTLIKSAFMCKQCKHPHHVVLHPPPRSFTN